MELLKDNMIQEIQIRAILDTIEGTDYAAVGSMELLKEYGFKLTGWNAFTGQQMAECKEAWLNARRKAMVNLVASLKANGAVLSPSLQKDYVNDLCAKEAALYELAERCNRACVHSIDLVRTVLSQMKEEMIMNR